MFADSKVFSSYSIDDVDKAKQFYGETLGLPVEEQKGMGLHIKFTGGGEVFMYPKPNHEPASFTVLNFGVEDIDKAVDALIAKGVKMEYYEDMPTKQDDKGIARSDNPAHGPSIAWFKDPAGNILAVLH